ncbi:MAG TPA: VWA domain-containing protein [Vicinamibacterales bacterium]|jgi:Mg-chelatase subunit ChlD|nr:VWA domain-containing protein [Vicinamibacterales bacterium]
MQFGIPAALWLLLLALLPLLALRRRPARRLPVATMHLWAAAAAREAAPLARRVRRHWLALLQAAIVAAIALAVAGPFWPSQPAVAALVVDTSLSMSARSGGTTRLALATARAAAWAATLPGRTRVRLVDAAPEPRLVGEFPARSRELERALAELRPTDAGAPLGAAVDFARSASPAPGRLLVVTDAAAPEGDATEWTTVGSPADNLALVSLSARRPHADALDAEVLAHVWNFGTREASTTLTLSRNGGELVRRPLTLPAHAGATVVASVHEQAGIVTARLDADDAIAGDNTRHAVIEPPLAIRVAVTGANDFLEQALRTRPGVVLVPPSEPADVAVCVGCAAPAAGGVSATTGALVVAPPAAAPAAAAPLTVESTVEGLATSRTLDGADVVAVEGAEPAPGSVVARAGNRPAILAYDANGRRVMELRLDLARSPLVLAPAFPILIADALDWLAGRDLAAATFDAGRPIVRPLPRGGSGAPQVVGPGDTVVAATADLTRVTVAPATIAGVYRVRQGSAEDSFVVNPVTRAESDLSVAAASTPRLRDRLPAASTSSLADLSGYVLIAALALAAIEWRLRPGRWPSPRSAALALAALALLNPRLPWGQAPRAIVFALDTSDSMSARRAEALAAVARSTAGMQRGDRAGLLVFGADATMERPLDTSPLTGAAPGARALASATNLEQAIQTARAAVPADSANRVVLVSDGRETTGDARAAALAARAAGIPVDVIVPQAVAVSGRRATVTRLVAPPTVHQGEPFDLAASVEGAPGAAATVVFEAAGAVLDRRPVTLPAGGAATVAVTVQAGQRGLSVYRAAIEMPEEFADVADETAGAVVAVEGEPRLLNVSDGSAPAASPAGYRVESTTPDRLPRTTTALAAFDAIVLDDVDASRLDASQRRALAQHVEQGGGLFVLGSARSLLPLDDTDPLDAVLPIDLRPRRGGRAPGLALVVVFDKSGSMDDRIDGAPRIEFARQAARRVLASLPATDAVGVIAFDAAAVDVAELRPGHEPAALAARLDAVRPSGSTAIAPALERAVEWLRAPAASGFARRLVLLVSDGRTSPADQARARAALRPGIELSTVALGDEADRAFLSDLARTAGGRAFYPRRLDELPALAAREAVRVSGGRIVEEPVALQPTAHPVLTGIDTTALPSLGGYVVSVARAGADVAVRSPLGDPILALWRRGLGKVAVYTADLRSPWSAALRAWPQGPALLAQTARWVSRRVDHPFLHTEAVERDGQLHLTVDARGAGGEFLTGLDVRATGRTPAGAAIDLVLTPSGPGAYDTVVPLADPGPYTFSIAAVSADGRLDARVQRGVYWTAPRERGGDVDRARLAEIARLSGGRQLAPGDDPFGGPRPLDRRPTRPLLAVAALIAFLAHVVARPSARTAAAHAASGAPQRTAA